MTLPGKREKLPRIVRKLISMLEAESCQVLSPGQRVRFRHRGQWQPRYIKDQVHTRSYNVEGQNGDQFRRNRRDIIQSKETSFKEPIVELDDEDEDTVRDKESSDSEVENLETTDVEDA